MRTEGHQKITSPFPVPNFLLQVLGFNMVSQPTTPPSQGDKNASAGLLATTILVTVLSIILVILRFATRIWLVKRVGWDDWCILFACLGHPIGMALVVV